MGWWWSFLLAVLTGIGLVTVVGGVVHAVGTLTKGRRR